MKLIETYYPEKAIMSSTILLIIKNFFSTITLFGNKDLKLSSDFFARDYDVLYFGASAIPIRYGILGLLGWIITYLPFFIRSFAFIGLNNTNKNLRAVFAYSSLLIASIMALRQDTLFTPFFILIGEYVQLKFPIEKQ